MNSHLIGAPVTLSSNALLLAACALITPLLSAQAPAQQPLLVDIDHRASQSLDGDWHIIADPYRAGISSFHGAPNPNGYFKDDVYSPESNKLVEYSFAKSPTIKVPGDWNTQAEWLRLYEGPLWYQRYFDYTPQPGHRAFLHIGAANYRSNVFVNGKQVCEHEGGFTPFDCEITAVVKPGQNDAVILVDNTRIADGVPTLKTDWYNYGGLTRDVSVVTTSQDFIDDYDLHLDRATRSTIEGYVHVEGATGPTPVSVSIPELHIDAHVTTGSDGRATVKLPAKNLSLWSPSNPKLYKITLKAGDDTLTDDVGFRTVETRGSEILLNGEPVFLRGVSIHAEAPFRTGRAYSQKDVDTLLGWVKELGGNYARLAHYPHDERMTRTADRLGILIWSEIPVYWAEQFDDETVFNKSKQQLTEEIRRDRNKASIILWSIANETPSTPARTAFLTRSAELVHQLDPTRLVTAALLVHGDLKTKYIDDPLGKALDVIGFNEYIGWYEGQARGRRHDRVEDLLRQAAHRLRVRRRSQGRPPRSGDAALDRGVPGQPLSPSARYAQQDPAAPRHEPLVPHGLPLPRPPAPGHPGRLQPKRPHLRPGSEEGGLLHARESVPREHDRQTPMIIGVL